MATATINPSATSSPKPTNRTIDCPHCGGLVELPAHPVRSANCLTPAELKVVEYLLEHGCSNKEIGQHFRLSTQVVKNYLRKAYRKLGVHTRTELLRHWPNEIFQAGLKN